MIYVKFIVSTEYCGTENEIFLAYEDGTPESSIEIDFLERVRESADSYSSWEYITEEEYKEGTE